MEDGNSPNNKFTAGDRFFGQMIEARVADEQFIKDIVEMFIQEGKITLSGLIASFSTKNVQDIKLLAHKLKSSFLMFDMLEAHELAIELENYKSETHDKHLEQFENLNDNCEQIFILLEKKYLNK